MFTKNRIGWFLLAAILSTAPLPAQVVTGAITGRITDTTGAVIPEASVQVQNVETGLARNVQTDAGGRYVVRNLPVGSYTVTAQRTGFGTLVRSGITLTVGSEVTLNLELSVGTVQERVEVTAEAPAIETTTATLSGLINTSQIRDLPLNGRSLDELALLTPGVVEQTNTARSSYGGQGRRLVIGGSRPTQVLYLLDGTVSNDYNMNGPGSAAGQSLGVEAVREFRIITHNQSAEYGRSSGGVFSSITRSGTNEFHGSAYEFVRNNIFDARNFFNRGELPAFRRNQFGVSLGGPVVRNRLFFFANYEGFRERQGITQVSTVPDLDARRGFIRNAAGQLPAVPIPINPAVIPYLNMIPEPNGPRLSEIGSVARYSRDVSTATSENYSMARLDFNLSEKDSLYYRLVYDPSDSITPGSFEPWFGGGENHYGFHLLSHTRIISPTTLNEFRFAFNRTIPRLITGPLDVQNGALDFIPGQGFGLITFRTGAIATGGIDASLTQFGNSQSAPREMFTNLFQVTDTFSHVRGAHSLKFGFDVQRQQANYRWGPFPNKRGIYAFGTFENFLRGVPVQLNFPLIGIDGSEHNRGWRQTVFGWFLQDDWRLLPNLTLNLGLRHEFVTAPTEVNGRMASLHQLTDAVSVIGPPFPTSKDNFGPRFGLAWDPTGSGKTSVRAGLGMFYQLPVMGRIWDTSVHDYRFAKSFVINNPPNFPNALLSNYAGQQSTRGLAQDLKTTTSVHWNVEISREIVPSLSLQVAYVGSKLTHLEQGPEANRAIGHQVLPDGSKFFCPASAATAPPCPATAPQLPLINPNFSQIQWVTTPGWGIYHGLQLGLQKRLSRGLQFGAGYTWSKNMSTVDQQFGGEVQNQLVGPMDLDDLARDYSLSLFHQAHVFNINGKYQMPWDRLLTSGVARTILGGWEVNTNWRATTGLPQVIGAGFNVSRNRHVLAADRPNLTPGFKNYVTEGVTAGCTGVPAGRKLGTPELFYDPCAYSLPLAGMYGNLVRNALIGPGLFVVNVGLVKNTPLAGVREGMNLEFRAEAFNLFNHANFRQPAAAAFSANGARNPNAGRLTATSTDNRQLQLGMKLTF